MRFMLDTNICIGLLRRKSQNLVSRLRRRRIDDIALSSITLAELHYGAAKSARPSHHELLLVQFCAPFAIVPFDDVAAQAYGRVRGSLERSGAPIGPLDTLIASHAIALGLTLITDNEKEFRRVEGLRVENWLKS